MFIINEMALTLIISHNLTIYSPNLTWANQTLAVSKSKKCHNHTLQTNPRHKFLFHVLHHGLVLLFSMIKIEQTIKQNQHSYNWKWTCPTDKGRQVYLA